jgi:predicted metal-dependent phosphotriesterase family hydrolase
VEAIIRTVLGDIRPDELGRTNVHEHLLQRSPLLRGEELDDVQRSLAEVLELRDAGMDALVELTNIGIGRDPIGVAEIARRSGVKTVLATGIHRQAHYPPGHWIHSIEPSQYVGWFLRDIREGCNAMDYAGPKAQPTGIRAGVIKVGAGYWSISPFEHRVLEAAAQAHVETGVPIVCHLEMGTAAWEVLDLLSAAGVPHHRVLLAHVDRNPDPGLHTELAAAGAYLGYDGMARYKYWPDSTLLECLVKVASAGGADRLTLGGDVARRSSFRAYGGLPGLAYLPKRFIPRLQRMGGEELVHTILVSNPARFLAFVPKE